MRRFYRVLGAALVLLCLAGAQAETPWVEIKSPHFNVLTDGSEKQGRDVALRFEQMRSVFAQLFVKSPARQPVPLQVIALRTEREISQYAPLYQGKPVKIVGFYLQNQDKNYILLDLGANNLWETIFHEYSHCLLDTLSPNLPVWFTEGFAEFYSTVQVANRQATIGRPPEAVLAILKDEKLMPVSELMDVDRHSPIYNNDHRARSIFYAESWLLVHYLLDNQRMDRAEEYFELRRRHVPVSQAIKQAFEMEAKDLDLALEKYLRAGPEFMRLRLPEEAGKIDLATGPVPVVNASAVLADVHSHQPDYRRRSIEEFQEILRQDPENTTAHRGLGYALFHEHNTEAAIPHLRKAAEKSPDDWLIHYYWASLMAQQQEDDLAPQVEREARLVTQLNPEMADGHALLGFALMTERKTTEATSAYEVAVRLDPASEIYALNLAELYTLQGKMDQAKSLFLSLQYSDNPTVSTAARSHLDLMAAPKKTEMN
jgi:tetratricopeptide (TPR) repeat protein